MSTDRPSPIAPPLAFGIAGAPAAWIAQELAGWYLANHGCVDAGVTASAPPGMRSWQIAMNALSLLVAIASLATGVRQWRARRIGTEQPAAVDDRRSFLAAAAMLVSAVFLLAIGWASIAAFAIPLCVRMR
jgi:hypothetical protein